VAQHTHCALPSTTHMIWGVQLAFALATAPVEDSVRASSLQEFHCVHNARLPAVLEQSEVNCM
jgi:hypothetical protein